MQSGFSVRLRNIVIDVMNIMSTMNNAPYGGGIDKYQKPITRSLDLTNGVGS